MDEYQEKLEIVQKKFEEFMKWAKLIGDSEVENSRIKPRLLKANVELRAMLNSLSFSDCKNC